MKITCLAVASVLVFVGIADAQDRYTVHEIKAGATCTDPIVQPQGVHAVAVIAPNRDGFISPNEVHSIHFGGQYVQFCFVAGGAREEPVKMRVAYEPIEPDLPPSLPPEPPKILD